MTPSKTSRHSDEKGVGYDVRYRHEIYLKGDGVPLPMVEWCGQHCKGRWGWYFKDRSPMSEMERMNKGMPPQTAVMTFEFDKDAFWFSLVHGET